MRESVICEISHLIIRKVTQVFPFLIPHSSAFMIFALTQSDEEWRNEIEMKECHGIIWSHSKSFWAHSDHFSSIPSLIWNDIRKSFLSFLGWNGWKMRKTIILHLFIILRCQMTKKLQKISFWSQFVESFILLKLRQIYEKPCIKRIKQLFWYQTSTVQYVLRQTLRAGQAQGRWLRARLGHNFKLLMKKDPADTR